MESIRHTVDCQDSSVQKKVELTLYLGHKAAVRKAPTAEGFTHDWIVFLKPSGGCLDGVLEKIDFLLHPTFKRPVRSCLRAPYQVVESGYGGFVMPVDMFFNLGAGNVRKVRTMYTLFLGVTPTVSSVRKEIITFLNPSQALFNGLLQAGGVPSDHYHDDDVVLIASPQSFLKRPQQPNIAAKNIFPGKEVKETTKRRPGRPRLATKESAAVLIVDGAAHRKRGRPKKTLSENIASLEVSKQPVYKQTQIDQQFKKVKHSTSFEKLSKADESEVAVNKNTSCLNTSSFSQRVSQPLMTSTPTKQASNNPNTKRLKLRFKPTVEELSFEEDEEKVLISQDIHSYQRSLARQHKHLAPLNDLQTTNNTKPHQEPDQRVDWYLQQLKQQAASIELSSKQQSLPIKQQPPQELQKLPQQLHQLPQELQKLPQQLHQLPQQQKTYDSDFNACADIGVLMTISQKLGALRDKKVVRKVMQLIQQTGLFSTTQSSFDFDLCRLDPSTLNAIRRLLEV